MATCLSCHNWYCVPGISPGISRTALVGRFFIGRVVRTGAQVVAQGVERPGLLLHQRRAFVPLGQPVDGVVGELVIEGRAVRVGPIGRVARAVVGVRVFLQRIGRAAVGSPKLVMHAAEAVEAGDVTNGRPPFFSTPFCFVFDPVFLSVVSIV